MSWPAADSADLSSTTGFLRAPDSGAVPRVPTPTSMSAPPAPVKAFDVTQMLADEKQVNITAVRMERPLSVGEQIRRRFDFSFIALKHTGKIISRNKLNYCLGFAACFTLVFVVALVQTVLNQVPLATRCTPLCRACFWLCKRVG